MANILTWLIAVIGSELLYVSGLKIQDGTCAYRKWEKPGDVKLLVIGGMYESEAGQCTTQLSKDGILLILTLDWMIQTLNGNNSNNQSFIPGLKIGYDIYENCNNKDLTTDLLYSDHKMSNCSGQLTNPDNYASVISLTSPDTTRTLSRLVHPLPVVRPLPSTPLLLDIPNLVQTVAPFTFEVQAMVDLMVHMKWNYIAVVNEDTGDGQEMATEFKSQARSRSVCVKFQYTLQMTTVTQSAANITNDLFYQITSAYNMSIVIVYLGGVHGAIHTVNASKTQRRTGSKLTWMFPSFINNNDELKTKFTFDNKYDDIMISLNYPQEILDEIKTHSESIKNGSKHSPITNIMPTFNLPLNTTIDHSSNMINAVLATTAALKGVWDDVCNGQDATSCTALPNKLQADMLNRIKNSINVSSVFQPHHLPQAYQARDMMLGFDDDGTITERTLEVLLFTPKTNNENKLFTYTGDGIPGISINLPPSACASNTVCLECRETFDLRYSYLPGDYLILGIFSLRVYDDKTNRCQSLRRGTNDIITVSAFMQAILKKRTMTGLNFGGIAIDDCYSSYNTSHYLSGLFSKTEIIRDPSTGRPIDFDRVIAIIGALSSSVTLVVSDTATSLRLPMISYAASSPELDNRDRYPYFLRTVPSDILQVKGIINIINFLNITRVGVIYIDDSYGKSGLKNLQIQAANNNICIDSPLRIFLGMSDMQLKAIVTRIKELQLGVVVYFSIDSIAQRLLEKINEDNDIQVVFIASEAWGTNRALITGELGKASKGSLVFNIAALQSTNASFRTFLRSLNSTNSQYNRWLPNLFERENSCDLIGSFEKEYTKLCDNSSKTKLDNASIENLYKDQRGIHVMNAVHTVTEGYKNMCYGDSSALCSRNKPELFMNKIEETKIDSEKVYTPEGNGNIGMTINNIQRDPDNTNEFNYKQIGTFSKDGVLTITESPIFYNDVQIAVTNILDVDNDMETNTDCDMFQDSCSNVCLRRTTETPDTTTSVIVTQPTTRDDSLMRGLTIGFGVLAGIMAVALILLIALLLRRQDADRHSSDGKYSTEATSVNPDNTSIYDEPGTIYYGRSRSENDFRMRGSFKSLQDTTPTQYAHIKPSPVPIHHKRHMSNQELVSHHSYLQERPSSPQSAPLTQLQVSPVARHISAANKRCTRTPHSPYVIKTSNSPHSTLRSQELYRKRGDISPKSRHVSEMRVSSVNSLPVIRRGVLDSDDYGRNSVFADESLNGPLSHNPGDYLYPQTGSVNKNMSSDTPTLTYLTAKDFVREESLDEEEKQTDNDSKTISNDSEPVNTQQSNQNQRFGYDPSLISPSNNEIIEINFPENDTVRFSKLQPEQREATFIDNPMDTNKESMVPRAGSSGTFSQSTKSNQPDIIPETGLFENDDGVIII